MSQRLSGLDEVYSGGLDEMYGELKVLVLRGFTVQYVGKPFEELGRYYPSPNATIQTIQVRAPRQDADKLVEIIKMTRHWSLCFAYDEMGIRRAVTRRHETHDMHEALDMVFEWARDYM